MWDGLSADPPPPTESSVSSSVGAGEWGKAGLGQRGKLRTEVPLEVIREKADQQSVSKQLSNAAVSPRRSGHHQVREKETQTP